MVFVTMFPERIMEPLAEATETNLRKLGARIRTRARESLQYGRKASRPGQPPTVHRSRRQSSSPLRNFLLYDVKPPTEDVQEMVCGPALLPGKAGTEKLQKGGTITTKRGDRITIKPRPFMAPAFAAEAMSVGDMWKDSI